MSSPHICPPSDDTPPTPHASTDESPQPQTRPDAIRALESEFSALITRYRILIARHAHSISEGMLPGSYKVFASIANRGETTLSALAESMMLDKGWLSRTVHDLEKRGLITRTPDPDDRRSSLLSLTAIGRERLDAVRHERDGLGKVLDAWPIEDIHEFTRMLRALHNGFGEEEPADADSTGTPARRPRGRQ